jgi:hypothetical protein
MHGGASARAVSRLLDIDSALSRTCRIASGGSAILLIDCSPAPIAMGLFCENLGGVRVRLIHDEPRQGLLPVGRILQMSVGVL